MKNVTNTRVFLTAAARYGPVASSKICAQWCQTLCDHMDYSPPGSSVHDGLLFPSPGEADSPELKMDSLPTESPGEPCLTIYIYESRSVMSDSLWPHGLYSPWNSPGQNTGEGSHSLLQGIFPTQGLNPDLLHWRWILYQWSQQQSPRILEWVAYPFSSRSSRPRNRTRVSCIVGRVFTSWATKEASVLLYSHAYYTFLLLLWSIVLNSWNHISR